MLKKPVVKQQLLALPNSPNSSSIKHEAQSLAAKRLEANESSKKV